jgi:ADP-ribosylglycohydrolase
MTIATVEGLLEASEQERSGVFWHASGPVWERYVRWAESQRDQRERRYPGATSLTATESGVPGEIEAPLNDSKGSGGIMRISPIGLAFAPEQAFEQGAEIAALTHGHPNGYLAAGFLADVVSRIVRGASRGARDWNAARGGTLPGAIAETREVLLGYDDHDEVLEAVDSAVELYMSDVDLDTGFEALGEGWVAEEALGIALFSALNFPEDFAEGVLAAVNITGDSDTTGSITGALLGAMLGESGVPAEWTLRVEGSRRILELADALYDSFIATPVE